MKINTQEFGQRKRREALEVVVLGMSGELSIVEVSRIVAESRSYLSENEFEKEFYKFIEIASDSDVFPLGQVRELWNPSALARVDKEMIEFENRYRQDFDLACERLLAKFKDAI